MGHINYAMDMERDRKGIYGQVTLDNVPVEQWTLTRIPFESIYDLTEQDNYNDRLGGIFKGSFSVSDQSDTWMDMSSFDKGYVIVNGYNLGRYWTVKGPQQRLFCPGVWLKSGVNEIIVVDVNRQETATVTGFELYKGCPEGQHLEEDNSKCTSD